MSIRLVRYASRLSRQYVAVSANTYLYPRTSDRFRVAGSPAVKSLCADFNPHTSLG